jgi:hypothetical protein
MARIEEDTTVQYRFTPSKEAAPRAGDVLHACGLTNWHMQVRRVLHTSAQSEDGTVDVKLAVWHAEIGKENRPCPVCGAPWMAASKHGA